MKVYAIVHDSPYTTNNILEDDIIYYSKEIAEKYWNSLDHNTFSYSIKELEFIEK